MNIHKIINYKENNQVFDIRYKDGKIVFIKDMTKYAMIESLNYRYRHLKRIDNFNGSRWCFDEQKYKPISEYANKFMIKYYNTFKRLNNEYNY